MKIKILLVAALMVAATWSAHAGIHFGFLFGAPLPVPVVAARVVVPVAPQVVVTPPMVAAPGYAYPAPVCAGPDYECVWMPGYWCVTAGARVWVPGCWHRGYAHGHASWGGGWSHGGGWHR